MLAGSAFYVFVVLKLDQPTSVKVGMCHRGDLSRHASCRRCSSRTRSPSARLSIKRAFPDALDLLLICVESGMSIEAGFKKVSAEIGSQSIPLAEELTLTTAELSYLQERQQAYENLAKRTNIDGVKSVCMALQQAERYGTPLGQTLRVMAQENRDMRMSEAEKKAAGLPPKLTVPMILFFLPVLFVVILGPAGIRVSQMNLMNADGLRYLQRTKTLRIAKAAKTIDAVARCRAPATFHAHDIITQFRGIAPMSI